MIKINNVIGNTPLIKINYLIEGIENYFYAKLEWYNLSGSVKDRVAEYIILESKKQGLLKDNQTIVETTSGNTGISLAAIGAKYKHKIVIYIPESASKERIQILKMYGADVRIIKLVDGGFKKCIELSKEYAKKHNAFLFNQFYNELNSKCHEVNTARELSNKLENIDYFVSGIGSGGTAMGIINGLRKKFNTKLIVVEPYESQILRKNTIGIHKIEGIGDDFIPGIVDTNLIDNVLPIKSDDAILVAQKLAKELGLGVGISSGANALACMLLSKKNKNIVTLFSDDLKKYLSTDLTKELKSNKVIDSIKFINYEIIS